MPLPAVARLVREPQEGSPRRSRASRTARPIEQISNSASNTNNSSSTIPQVDRPPHTYGYHNTFHTHESPPSETPPPSYNCAVSPRTMDRLNSIAEAELEAQSELPPSYTCSVEIGGILGLKNELSSPFLQAGDRHWHDVYVVLRGTQLNIHRIKTSSILSRSRVSGPGRLLRSYTLQHAEIGLASDFKKSNLIPKSPFAYLVPIAARQRVFETDPHLFEPVREFVLRLRVETEQILLCCQTQEELMDWVEKICAAIDISSPIDDRSEPRCRSLPRRSRRQRQLDGTRIAGNIENLEALAAGRRLLAEQERIIRMLYPHLADLNNGTESANSEQPTDAQNTTEQAVSNSDPEAEDLDPADVRFPSSARRPNSSALTRTVSANSRLTRTTTTSSVTATDPKAAPRHTQTPAQSMRYRRRCAPILLAASPRASDVVFSEGKRMRISVKDYTLVDYTVHPPRYDAHGFARQPCLPFTPEESPSQQQQQQQHQHQQPQPQPRSASPQRGSTDGSLAFSFSSFDADTLAFGYDLASTSSSEHADRLRLGGEAEEITSLHASDTTSEPPSPTTATAPSKMAKVDTTRRQVSLRKMRTSEDGARDRGLSALAMGAAMLI
ncbi:hypothetical protein K432DRAFT_286785 [Lepidopterella palustris CBS 459.81]|uniref:PH domain-containing protein n=1 Tax=Lepidopterella palustris CBS 459.81 TaxID=1314670 RepID=A0A8E2JK46_9PEZI|nr:hypothetical protein K432DRAFT_286785 [Lepidopterella palustris CBS 459.81]